MEFTLSALQPHVINQWRATLELSAAITKDQLIKLRIWRDVAENDTSAIDPHASGKGQEIQTLRIGRPAPITITDVGNFSFLVTEPVISDHELRSVILKIYKR